MQKYPGPIPYNWWPLEHLWVSHYNYTSKYDSFDKSWWSRTDVPWLTVSNPCCMLVWEAPASSLVVLCNQQNIQYIPGVTMHCLVSLSATRVTTPWLICPCHVVYTQRSKEAYLIFVLCKIHNHRLISLSATMVTTQWLKQPIIYLWDVPNIERSIPKLSLMADVGY